MRFKPLLKKGNPNGHYKHQNPNKRAYFSFWRFLPHKYATNTPYF